MAKVDPALIFWALFFYEFLECDHKTFERLLNFVGCHLRVECLGVTEQELLTCVVNGVAFVELVELGNDLIGTLDSPQMPKIGARVNRNVLRLGIVRLEGSLVLVCRRRTVIGHQQFVGFSIQSQKEDVPTIPRPKVVPADMPAVATNAEAGLCPIAVTAVDAAVETAVTSGPLGLSASATAGEADETIPTEWKRMSPAISKDETLVPN